MSNLKRTLPESFSNKQHKHYIIMDDGRRGRRCELCGKVKREKSMTTRAGHDVCSVCARSPRRQMRAIVKERASLFINPKFIKTNERKVLVEIWKAQGMDGKKINKRLKELRTELAVTKELRKFKKNKEAVPNFNEAFSRLVGIGKEDDE